MSEVDHNESGGVELETQTRLKVRQLVADDAEAVASVSGAVYENIDTSWTGRHFLRLLEIFPEGQIGVEDDGEIVAFAFSLIVDYDRYGDDHSYAEITGDLTFSTHDADGDVLYGIEVCVEPGYQGRGIGQGLYDARKKLCENLNLRSVIVGGRMPNYDEHDRGLTPREYIESVRSKEVYDPVMTFQIGGGFHVKKILNGYFQDGERGTYATLLGWDNVSYQRKKRSLRKVSSARVGAVQLEMRPMSDTGEFFKRAEFFINAVAGYAADFVCFPEYVNAPLMTSDQEDGAVAAIRKLAGQTEEIRDFFLAKAVEHKINIITGSMPLHRKGCLYNVTYLCRRDGSWEMQQKLHITPAEEVEWGMAGGEGLEVFQTDAGRVAILICYDVEFPELGRILADQGVEILFVPFCTDTVPGYYRVRHCAQARAIENECYVMIAGSVGNLPDVSNMDVQYAQSAVLSPSDFAFPQKAVVSEAAVNTEMVLVADVDFHALKNLHAKGSVRNLSQRRDDLYSLKWFGR